MSDIRTDPREFRRKLVIDVDGQPRRLESAIDPWQRADFEALDGGFQVAAGIKPTYPVLQRAWLERPRGHSKTTDVSVMAAWPLLVATRPLRGYWAAVDKDQARLSVNAFDVLCKLNPPLAQVLEVGRDTITNRSTGATLQIISSDAASSWGLLPDFIFADEVTHWSETNGQTLFGSLFSSAAKRPNCLFGAITNAGFADTWQEKIATAAKGSPGWYYSRLDGPRASWITAERLEEQRKFLPPAAFNRVWLNVWSTSAGDALVEEDVRASVRDKMALPNSIYSNGRWAPGILLMAALDIGISRDHSALMAIAADLEHQKFYQFYSQSWAPPIGGKVDLSEVELACEQLVFEHPYLNLMCDPYQAESIIQRLSAKGYRVHGYPATPKNLSNWATSLVAAFVNRQVSLMPDDAALVAQLLKLRVLETPNGGFKLQAPRDRIHGHCDKAIAFSMCLGETMLNAMIYAPWVDDGLGESVLDLYEREMSDLRYH